MNNRSFLFLNLTAMVFASALGVRAQTSTPSTVYTRPRTVSAAQQQPQGASPGAQTPAPRPSATPDSATATPARQVTPTANPNAAPSAAQNTWPPATQTAAPASPASPYSTPRLVAPYVPLQPARSISVNKFREHVTEAQRLLKSRLTLTAMTPNTAFVTVAALEPDSSKIHLLSVPKETFLTRGAEVVLTTAQRLNVRLQIVRPNYVNTAVVVSDAATGKQFTPLLVEYPIE